LLSSVLRIWCNPADMFIHRNSREFNLDFAVMGSSHGRAGNIRVRLQDHHGKFEYDKLTPIRVHINFITRVSSAECTKIFIFPNLMLTEPECFPSSGAILSVLQKGAARGEVTARPWA
jgi:hypothetical protein